MSILKNIRRLANLTERMEALEKDMRSLRLDWDEMYERYRKMSSRVALDRRKIEEAQNVAEEDERAAEIPLPNSFSSLSPRQRQITEQILRHRQTRAREDGG